MLAEVTAVFRDVHTGAVYKAGEQIEIAKRRFDEVNKKLPGYLVEVELETSEPVEKPVSKRTRKK